MQLVQGQHIQNPLVQVPHVQDPHVQDHGQWYISINWDLFGTYNMSLGNRKNAISYHSFLLAMFVTLQSQRNCKLKYLATNINIYNYITYSANRQSTLLSGKTISCICNYYAIMQLFFRSTIGQYFSILHEVFSSFSQQYNIIQVVIITTYSELLSANTSSKMINPM